MGNKTITMRLTESVYEKLCQLANKKDELPTETARRILREKLADTKGDSNEETIVAEVIPDEEETIVAKVIPDEEETIVAEVIYDDE